jgi:putative NIF3 family GTP cyclohydrolase 1 type 2
MSLTIQAMIDRILAETPGGLRHPTVDTVKAGDPSQPVSGVVTTCMATVAVIRQAIAQGANLIVTHEPTFYNHLDETESLADDSVYLAKRELIDSNGLVVWRYHDHIHALQLDGIVTGLLRQLGWQRFADEAVRGLCVLPPASLWDLVAILKGRLGLGYVKVLGDPALVCQRVGLAVGAAGGARQIAFLREQNLDLLVCGEINEWETAEYVRDADLLGHQRALVLLGHINSEEPGMAWLADWLRERFPDVPVTHVPAGDVFGCV